ncbi:unnamed protein product, partial [Acanthocheilonema viteae]
MYSSVEAAPKFSPLIWVAIKAALIVIDDIFPARGTKNVADFWDYLGFGWLGLVRNFGFDVVEWD